MTWVEHELRASRGRRPLALVVDDNRDGRELATFVLERAGFEVHDASTGPEALQCVLELMPHLIVLDLALPGIDGCEIARRLRGLEQLKDVRIMAWTAHAEASALQRARDAGCDSVLTKPCSPDDLVSEALRLTGGASSRQGVTIRRSSGHSTGSGAHEPREASGIADVDHP